MILVRRPFFRLVPLVRSPRCHRLEMAPVVDLARQTLPRLNCHRVPHLHCHRLELVDQERPQPLIEGWGCSH
jgi:hypothetical protein